MNKTRPFSLALAGAAGYLAALLISPGTALAQAPAPSETASTPPADADEKSPPTDSGGKDQITETDIDATQSATFNSKDRVAVFIGNVKVVDPRFQLVCDRLTVFLAKPAPAGQNAPATPAPAAPTGKSGKGKGDSPLPSGGGGIDHAVAEGHVVIIQKKAAAKPGEEEKLSIGRGATATFDGKTGDMVLKGWPSLEQNGSSQIATSAGTVMTILRDGNLNTQGPSKTKLIQRGKGGEGFELPGAPSVPNKSPGAGRRGAATPAPANGGR